MMPPPHLELPLRSSATLPLFFVFCALFFGSVLACSKAVPLNPDQPPDVLTKAGPAFLTEQPVEIYPGVTLDRENQHVDVRCTVVGRDVDWLELLACRPGTREYESIVTVDADAAHINIALTLLGLEPGQPARTRRDEDNQLIFFAPHGPALGLFFILDDQPDTLVPANTWVIDQETRQPMPGNVWVFTGSTFIEFQGDNFFMAEKNGTVVSLLNFGDELVSRPTEDSEAGGTGLWTAHTGAIPPIGTAVTLRFQPAAAE